LNVNIPQMSIAHLRFEQPTVLDTPSELSGLRVCKMPGLRKV
jgi:hypothetical protein